MGVGEDLILSILSTLEIITSPYQISTNQVYAAY